MKSKNIDGLLKYQMKKQYENKNFDKSLYYLDLIKGIPNIPNNNMTKVLDLRRLVESKVN